MVQIKRDLRGLPPKGRADRGRETLYPVRRMFREKQKKEKGLTRRNTSSQAKKNTT